MTDQQREVRKRLAIAKLQEHPVSEKELKDIREFLKLNFDTIPTREVIKELIHELRDGCNDKNELKQIMSTCKYLFEDDLEYAREIYKAIK